MLGRHQQAQLYLDKAQETHQRIEVGDMTCRAMMPVSRDAEFISSFARNSHQACTSGVRTLVFARTHASVSGLLNRRLQRYRDYEPAVVVMPVCRDVRISRYAMSPARVLSISYVGRLPRGILYFILHTTDLNNALNTIVRSGPAHPSPANQ